ncbi:MAG: TAXI family TRAP transporter solute-binding subunit [Burkholderiaceae bacterium]|nr:TAXI family TRAP transporter solute-binding subunit [Burkholderiaceae bacterium]
MKIRIAAIGAALVAASFVAQPALAADPKLPQTLAWSAYDVGSGGYNQAVAIGAAFKNKYGVNLRVIPGKNDVSRLLPLTTGKLDFVANGAGSYMAQEGLYEFGAKEWGPLPLRILMTNIARQAAAMIVAGDAGIRTPADLKGKRISWVIGGPALNQNVAAVLAFAGLTWDDVQKVEFGGYAASLDAIVNNQSDAGYSVSVAGKAYALEKSPRGIAYLHMPASDTEGWKRMQAIAPFMIPMTATDGAGLSQENPVETNSYPYPILHTLADRNADEVHAIMQAMVDAYPLYKDNAPGNYGWALERQNLEWVIPYHEGAIRYYKEKGVWTEAHQKHNDALIRRQDVLAEAWKKVKAQNLDGDAHMAAWQKARADALRGAGMSVVLEDW